MNTLILSCNTGEGHNSCAKAIKEYYDIVGEPCEIYDALKFISTAVSEIMSKGHAFIYRNIPALFNNGYKYAEEHPDVFYDNSKLYSFMTQGSEKIYDYIVKGKYDSVICTHVFTALMLTDVLKKYPLNITSSFVATDYTCSPSAKESNLNYYFIPDSELTEEFQCKNIPEHKIIISGIPVRQMFYRNEYKKNNSDKNTLLIMCGSMGCGPMRKVINRLSHQLPHNWDISVVCGRNHKLKKRLQFKYKYNKSIKIYGFVEDIGSLMDKADLYLTKPGGISTTEALTKKLPMLLIDAVAGCEEYNRKYFVNKGCASSAASTEELIELCLQLMNDDKKIEQMRNDIKKIQSINSAQIIYEKMNCNTM